MSALTAQNLYDLTSAVALVTGGGETVLNFVRIFRPLRLIDPKHLSLLSSISLLGTGIGLMCAKALAANGAKVCE